MRKITFLLCASMLFCGTALAQFTVVSGTISDLNGLPYSGASLTITLSLPTGAVGAYLNGAQIAGTVGPVKLDNTGAFLIRLADNTLIQCATAAGQLVACAPQTTWTFSTTFPGIAPPLGTGAQICNSTQTITGASQTLSLTTCPAVSRTGTGFGGFGGINVQTGNYTPVVSDCGKLIVFEGAANVTLTLPNPPFNPTCYFGVSNITTANVVTINRNGLTLNTLASNGVLANSNMTSVLTDGSNYFTGWGAAQSASNGNVGGLQAPACINSTGGNGDFNVLDTCGFRQGSHFIVADGGPGWLLSGAFNASAGGTRLKIQDQGTCTMAAGTCTAQTLGSTYTAAPNCFLTWTGAGTLTGILKVASTTTTVTPSSTVGTDTAVVNWACYGL